MDIRQEDTLLSSYRGIGDRSFYFQWSRNILRIGEGG